MKYNIIFGLIVLLLFMCSCGAQKSCAGNSVHEKHETPKGNGKIYGNKP